VAWFAECGVTVERVLSDNGSAYRFDTWRDARAGFGIAHKRSGLPAPAQRARYRTLPPGPRPTAWPATGSTIQKPSAEPPSRLGSTSTNHHRVHFAIGGEPPVSRLTNLPGHQAQSCGLLMVGDLLRCRHAVAN
jgi:hypothetical protein